MDPSAAAILAPFTAIAGDFQRLKGRKQLRTIARAAKSNLAVIDAMTSGDINC